MWLDKDSGLPLEGKEGEPPAEGAAWFPDDDIPREPPKQVDESWVPNFLLRELLHCDAEEGAIMAQVNSLLADVKKRRHYLEWRYKKRAEAETALQLKARNEGKKKKKKSIAWPFGKCGWKSKPTLEVTDKVATIAWARKKCPAAVKEGEPSLLTSALPKGVEIPGIKRGTSNTFGVHVAKPF